MFLPFPLHLVSPHLKHVVGHVPDLVRDEVRHGQVETRVNDHEHDRAEEREQSARDVDGESHSAAHVDRTGSPSRRLRRARPLPLAVLHGDDGPHGREYRQDAEDGERQLPAVKPI